METPLYRSGVRADARARVKGEARVSGTEML